MNLYALLADLVVAIHFSYVCFVVFGLLAIVWGGLFKRRFVRHFWFRIVHLAMILIVVTEALIGMTCPLTDWEYSLRIAAGQNFSDLPFMARLLRNFMFFDAPQYVFTLGYCLFGALVLATWLLWPPHWPRKRPDVG